MEQLLTYIFDNQILTGLTLSKCEDATILRTTGRLIKLKDGIYLSLESFLTDGKAVHKNIPVIQAADAIAQLIPTQFFVLKSKRDSPLPSTSK